MKYAYIYDENTKEYIGKDIAFLDQLESQIANEDIYVLPQFGTFKEPLEYRENYAIIFDIDNDEWIYEEDHRQSRDENGNVIEDTGTPYWLLGDDYTSEPRYMTVPGKLPNDVIFERPAKPLEISKEESKKLLTNSFENILNNAYLISSLGYKINANHTSKSNIEGLITYLSKETSITSTRFRIYDNTFVQVTIDDLNVLLLEVIKSINSLYDQKWIYDEKIKNSTTIEELESLEFTFTYSDFSK